MNEKFARANRNWADEHLEAWLDGELSPAEAERMERVLAASPELQWELDLARRIRTELEATPDYRCPPVVSRQVFAEVSEKTRRRDRRRLHGWLAAIGPAAPRWGLAGLAATVLLALGLWIVVPQFSAPEKQIYVVDGQTFTAAELADAQAQLELAMGYVDQLSNQINRQVGQYVAGDGMLAPVNKGLNRGASGARESLQKVYRDTSS